MDELENPLFDSVFSDMDKEPGLYTPAAPSMLDEAVDEVGRQSKVPTNLAAMKARDANPDQYQKISELSAKVGLDTGFVARNMPELQRQQTARDITEIAGKSPELGMWFAKDDNPAAIKVDELRHLSGLQWLVMAQVQSFQGGQQQVEFGTLANKALMGTATPEELARADEIFNGQQPRTYGADSWLEQAWVSANNQVPTLYNYMKQSIEGGILGFGAGAVAGGTAAAIGGQIGPQVATPEEIVTVPGAALATGIWTARAGALSAAYLYSFEQSAGPAYYEFKSMKDENGVPMDEDVARIAAYVTGAISGGLEVIGTEKIASLVPGADKVTGMFTKDAVKQALLQPTVRQALKTFAVNTAEAGVTEIGTEVAQEAVQIFAGEMAKVASNNGYGTSFESADAGEVAEQLIQAANETAKAMAILGPVLGSTRLGADLKKAHRASADKAILDQVIQHAQGDELLKRLPGKAQEAVKALTENGPVQSVYVQPDGIKTLFQSVEEMDAFIDSVGIRTEWNEAAAIGRDVQIPIEIYYAKLAATPAAEALAPYTKLSADAFTPLDADLFNEAWGEAKDSLLAEMGATLEKEKEVLSGVERIAEDVKTKAMNAGIVPDQAEQYSKLYSNFFRVMSSRMGLSPDEVYGRYGFDIARALPGGEYKPISALDVSLSAIRSGRIPSIRKRVEKAKGSSLLERVRQRGGIEDVGGEITATGLKGRQYVKKARGPDMLGGAESANTPDAVTDQLWQEGYFPEHETRPTPDVLYEAIRDELGGKRRYSATVEAKRGPEIAELAGLVAFADMLDELGVDPGTMTDDEVRAALEGVNRDAEAGALFQPAYHGTPHSFDKFSTDHIGAGEGNQAFGWGLYFSSKKEVAEWYRDELSQSVIYVDDKAMNPNKESVAMSYALKTLRYVDPDKALQGLDELEAAGSGDAAWFDDRRAAIESLRGKKIEERSSGKLYKVEVPDDAELMDFDKPLSSQPAAIQEAFKHLGVEDMTVTGGDAYAQIASTLGQDVDVSAAPKGWGSSGDADVTMARQPDPHAASIALNAAGVPGHKYIGTESSATNYVIYDDKRVEVKEYFQDASPTDSEAFRAWFGDSKVVDADGKPLVVYHGTGSDVDAFENKPGRGAGGQSARLGFFFTDSSDVASQYADETIGFATTRAYDRVYRLEQRGKYDEAEALTAELESGDYTGGMSPNVMPVYLSIKNPMEVDFEGRTYDPENDNLSEIIREAKSAGHDGVIFRNIDDAVRQGKEPSDHYVAFQPAQIKSFNNRGTFDPNDPRILFQDAKRGSIQISEGRTVINLFDQANLSTFLHESGHFFLEVFQDLAMQGGPDGPLAADWKTTTEFLGITDATIPTEAHEKFARSFETYLFEGNAPSEEVAGIFARFRSWLVFVYKSAARINAPINDKIRGVMDRLLATDEEIAAVKTAPEFRSAFKSAADAGMTEPQWATYQDQAAKAREQAVRTMDARMLGEVARETTAEWREAKRKIRDEVQAEYENEPVYRALRYLRTGDWSEYADDGFPIDAPAERLFLDRDAIVSIMGEGALERMPRSVPPIYRAKGGVSPDYLAELFGFQSGHDMLTRMMSVPSLARVVASEADVRMKEKFGDLMGDAVARSREAMEAITNDATGELLAAELEVLVRKGLVTTSIRKADAQRVAKQAIRSKPIREALRQKLYMNANSKAALEAERAILAKDWPAAVKAKQRQLVNHYMALEAVNAKNDVERAVNYLGKFTGKKRVNGIPADYQDQIEVILEKVDLRKAITLTETQRRASLAAFVEEKRQAGEMFDIPDEMLSDAFRKPYKAMSVDDLMSVRDAVKSIEHVGRNEGKLLAQKEAADLAAARDELAASVVASQDVRPPSKSRNPTMTDNLFSMLRSADASFIKMENFFLWLDGGDVNGPFNRLVWRPIAAAEYRENDLQREYTAKISGILNKLDKRRLADKITVLNRKEPMARSDIMVVALNMGSESNYDKMKRGEVWSDTDVDKIVENLNAEEWQAVEEIWATINSLWPQIAALQKRMTGREPTKIEARVVQTPYGQVSGGYFPLAYDPSQLTNNAKYRQADASQKRAANIAQGRQDALGEQMFNNFTVSPNTWQGFTKERVQNFTAPLLLNIDGIGQHLVDVIHDLTHREAIRDALKLLTSDEVKFEIESRYGREMYSQIIPWMQSIANDQRRNDGLKWLNKALRGVRSRATTVGLGFRLSTIYMQAYGYSAALQRVKVKHLAGSILDFGLSPRAMSAEVDRLSGLMRNRKQNLDRDIKDNIRRSAGKDDLASQARRFAMLGIGYADRAVSVPTWMAAYKEHLAQYPQDQAGAIAYGDQVVSLTQSSGGAKDLAAIMRNNEAAKLFTVFYSYFSAYYNQQRTWGRAAKQAIEDGTYVDFPDLLAQQVFMTLVPALLPSLIGMAILGPDDDDDRSWAAWSIQQSALYAISAVPFARDVANASISGYDYNFTPLGRVINEAAIKPIEMIKVAADPNKDLEARKAVKQTLLSTGYAFNLPTGQLATTIDNVWKAMEEDDLKLIDFMVTRKK